MIFWNREPGGSKKNKKSFPFSFKKTLFILNYKVLLACKNINFKCVETKLFRLEFFDYTNLVIYQRKKSTMQIFYIH